MVIVLSISGTMSIISGSYTEAIQGRRLIQFVVFFYKWVKRQFLCVYRCLDCNPGTKELFVAKCDRQSQTQRWLKYWWYDMTWQSYGPEYKNMYLFKYSRWKIENVDLQQLKKWEDPTRDLLLWYQILNSKNCKYQILNIRYHNRPHHWSLLLWY